MGKSEKYVLYVYCAVHCGTFVEKSVLSNIQLCITCTTCYGIQNVCSFFGIRRLFVIKTQRFKCRLYLLPQVQTCWAQRLRMALCERE